MLRRNELVLVTCSLRARSASVVTKKGEKKEKSKRGEVHRWRGRWLQTLVGI